MKLARRLFTAAWMGLDARFPSRLSLSSLRRITMSAATFRHRGRWLGAAVLLLAVILATGCNQTPPPKGEKTAEVVVTTPVSSEVLDYQDFTGRLDAIATVEIRAHVTGYINAAPFKEGDRVYKDDVLFQIDDRSYKADFQQAEANLKLAIADKNLQDRNSVRSRQMFGAHSIGKEEYDTTLASQEKAYANVGAATAMRDRAAVFLDYTTVRSPLTGRISRRFVDPGNLIKADDTMLTTVVADDNIYAYFDVDERTYLDLVGEKSSYKPSARVNELQVPVLMRLANEADLVHQGRVNFVDNRLNGNTGTIRMRAIFDNSDGIFKAGLFVRCRLPLGKPYKTFLIPDEAIMSDQGRKYVFVVNSDNEVVYRPVTLGQALEGLRAIKLPAKGNEGKEGIQAGERVIISGMQRVRAGQQVKVKIQAPPKAPMSPLGKLLVDSKKEAGVRSQESGVKGQKSDVKGQDGKHEGLRRTTARP
jgi:multidrug efflux system membrane fusion protein